MFERLKAIWNLPKKLELKEDRLKSYADMCQDCAEKNIRQRFEQHKNDIRSMIKSFSKTLTELREMVHPDHAKVQNFSERIAKLEEQVAAIGEQQACISAQAEVEDDDAKLFRAEVRLSVGNLERTNDDLKRRLYGLGVNYNELKEKLEKVTDKLGVVDIQTIMEILQIQIEADRTIRSQRNFTNRLLRLLRTTTEDPGKSITEDLRKAEKWNKTLRRKVRDWKERSEYRENQEAVNEG